MLSFQLWHSVIVPAEVLKFCLKQVVWLNLASHGDFLPYLISCVDVISLCNAASERHLKIGRKSNLINSVKLKWNGARKNSFARSSILNSKLSSLVGSLWGVSPSKRRCPKNWSTRHKLMTMPAWKVVTPVCIYTA